MRGIYLEAELLNSKAFRSLSRWSLQVYLRFLAKRVIVKAKQKNRADSHIVANNGEIVFCYSEAEKMGIPRREFRNSLDELIAKGLIDITHQGAGGRSKDWSTYFIADRWKKWGGPDYEPSLTLRVKNTRQGQGWAIFNARKNQLSVSNMSLEKPLSSDKNAIPKGKKEVFRVANMSPEKKQEIEICY